MQYLQKLCAILFLLTASTLCMALQGELIDFEARSQDFVLETKQIKIPGFDNAFNPTIVRWQGANLMSFRTRDPVTQSTHLIGFVWLDDDFNLISKPQLLNIEMENPYHPPRFQDPRLISCNGCLYVVYNNVVGPIPLEIRRMFIAELHSINGQFHLHHGRPLLDFAGAGRQPREKNWVPFVHRGNLLLADTIVPHSIQLPLFGTNSCQKVAETETHVSWDWGPIRGGTQAFVLNGEYLSFFHSQKDMRSAHSPKDKITHYFMGAYTFSAEPPFYVTAISPEPIVGKDFYHGEEYKTWKPLRVVFPGGFLFDKDFIWVAYGKQDHEVWIVKLDRRGLLNSLVPVDSSCAGNE